MFNSDSIAKRVMRAVKTKIANAQKRYDDDCKALDDEHNSIVDRMHFEKEQKKADLADQLVKEIVG